jgi:hypothetical protein
VYVIEYAAKLITTNLTTKFFNENFVKKIPTFDGRDLNKSTFKIIYGICGFSLKNRPALQVAGRKN